MLSIAGCMLFMGAHVWALNGTDMVYLHEPELKDKILAKYGSRSYLENYFICFIKIYILVYKPSLAKDSISLTEPMHYLYVAAELITLLDILLLKHTL